MLRIGLIGCGGIGKYHASRLVNVPDIQFTACCDIIPERAQKVASRTGAQPFTSFRDMLDLIDIAWICTPPESHHDITVECLKAGKDVFCEKPMALSVADADDMIRVSEETGRLLAIGYCLRFLPWAHKCKELVDSGTLGDITSVWITRTSPIPPTDWIPFVERSGGMLTEQTTHNLDWMRFVAGEVDTVFGIGQTINPGATIMDNASAVMRFKSGAAGQVLASWSCAKDMLESGIIGTKGTLKTGQGGRIEVTLFGQEPMVIDTEDIDMYFEEEKTFVKCAAEGIPYPVSPVEARKSLELSLAIHESAKRNAPVKLPL